MRIRLDHLAQELLLSGLTLLAVNALAAAQISLAEGGTAQAIVTVAADATPAEKHAADELAYFLGEVTGAKFEVATTAKPGQAHLLVGPGAAQLADASFSTEGLGPEGFILRKAGRDLILAGGRPRGTLYAVYTFLEDHVGCRWWTSKVSTIPKKPTLTIDKLDVRVVPRLEYRESFWYDALHGDPDGHKGDWAARNKCNGHSCELDEPRGGRQIYEGFVHTFYPLIPPEKYFKDHPDWFAELNGQRSAANTQLCLTNDAMRAELIKNLKERLRKNPQATIASVSQNDCFNPCQCAKCAAIDKEEGSPSGSLLRFVNTVAEEIEQEFPQVAIDTLAYQYTRKPPAKTRPRPNVIVRLCSIECSFSKPLDDDRNKAFRDDLLGWSQICNRLYIWDYTTNFAHYILPHPNLRVLGPNIRFFADHGVKGVFEQGAYQSYGSEMEELREWVLAKLLWDPSLDPEKLVNEFLDGYYGPAAPPIREYLKLTHDAVDASGDKLTCYYPPDAKFLSLATLTQAARLFNVAETAAKAGDDNFAATQSRAPGAPDLSLRVETAQLPILYTFLVRWDALRKDAEVSKTTWPLGDSPAKVYAEFMDIAKRANVTMISEGGNLDVLARLVPKAATQPAK